MAAGSGHNSRRPALLRRRRRRRLWPRAATTAGTGRSVLDHPAPPRDAHPAVDFFVLVTLHGHVDVVYATVVVVFVDDGAAVIIATAGAAAGLGVVLGVAASCHRWTTTVPYCGGRHGGVGLRVAGGFLRRGGGGRWRRRGSRRSKLQAGYGLMCAVVLHGAAERRNDDGGDAGCENSSQQYL